MPAIKQIDPNIFRAYDVRGVVGLNLTVELMHSLGQAIGSMALSRNQSTVVLGFDGRLSSFEFAQAMGEGLLSTGCDVIDIGMVPTPVLYYATYLGLTQSGVMITGSHNPVEYNGCKIVLNHQALLGNDIQELYAKILANDFLQGSGEYRDWDIMQLYLTQVRKNITLQRPLKIVVDAGHSVAGLYVGDLYRSLGCQVIELFCQVNGNFPVHHPDPSDAENLQDLIAEVLANKADLGLAFDGDGDRLGVISSDGKIIWPDRQLMLFALDVLSSNPGAKIVYDIKSSSQVADIIHAAGGEAILSKTGHSFIKNTLHNTHALLAGELSGHMFFRDRWYGFDDALYAGARLLEIIAAQQQQSSQVFAAIPEGINTPELKIAVADEEKSQLIAQVLAAVHEQVAAYEQSLQSKVTILSIDGVKINFAQRGWGLVRASNTTPCLGVRFEASTMDNLQLIQKIFRDLLLSVKADLILPF